MSTKYISYLKSSEWKKKRKSCIGYGGKKCFICGKRKNLHCHHKTYKNLGNEKVPTELFMVCAHHHKMIHDVSKSRNLSIWESTEIVKKEYGKKWLTRDTRDYFMESNRLQKMGL